MKTRRGALGLVLSAVVLLAPFEAVAQKKTPEIRRAQPVDDETAKALVMAQIARIVDEGRAATTRLESGVLELRFTTGEQFIVHAPSTQR